MSLFKKESHTRVVRNSTGKVIRLDRDDDDYQENRISQVSTRRDMRQQRHSSKRYEKQAQKKAEQEAFKKARNEERIRLKTEQGRRAAQHPITGLLPPRRVVHINPKQHQRIQQNKQRKVAYHGEFQNEVMSGMGHSQRQQTPREYQERMKKMWKW